LTAFPTTALDFEARFGDERACWDFLWSAKWPNGFGCPKCNGTKAYYVFERALEQCAACDHLASVTAGTMLHGTRKPLPMWFRAIFEVVSPKHGCNAMDIMRLLGPSYQTSWEWLHQIRNVFVQKDREPLEGEVEADETYIGGPEEASMAGAVGRKRILVFGAVEVVDGH
jgi:hypothetical protein